MTDAIKRALELVKPLEAMAHTYSRAGAERAADELRSAIRALGASEWREMDDGVPASGTPISLLCETDARRHVFNATLNGIWIDADTGAAIAQKWRPLAWKPADSTELPADWGTK